LEGGKRKILVVRQDRYEVDEERHVLFLKDWEMEMPFEGRLRWFGVQGRLEIRVEGNNFYAHISLTLVEPPQRKA
jgi:putative transposase